MKQQRISHLNNRCIYFVLVLTIAIGYPLKAQNIHWGSDSVLGLNLGDIIYMGPIPWNPNGFLDSTIIDYMDVIIRLLSDNKVDSVQFIIHDYDPVIGLRKSSYIGLEIYKYLDLIESDSLINISIIPVGNSHPIIPEGIIIKKLRYECSEVIRYINSMLEIKVIGVLGD